MREINIQQFSENLISTYRRYLYTTNFISDSEPELRQAVWNELNKPDIFVRGPIATCIPAYQHSLKGSELINSKSSPKLDLILSRLDQKEFDLTRPFYEHQIESL